MKSCPAGQNCPQGRMVVEKVEKCREIWYTVTNTILHFVGSMRDSTRTKAEEENHYGNY